ncbi:phosphatase PAP2 family protein [Permianibacter aggregans]|uniref:undecaprenyl-diphosphate phosphatase n=1 Tax=Permianibacter aggregans TaxID=1510150 RepID=A0A4R6UUG4_9GAMM|nr:phosphatase PAP2 family protein [Permianibacter aggregans]QGX39360.1 phosphatase PAP2 family protein [Permianibacter aggregans]TDQ49906.1 undecaprenyl-diphosphatase [Permianibacter aggregans]
MKRLSLLTLHDADTRLYRWCASRKHRDGLARTAYWVSKTGDGPIYAVIAILLAFFEPEHGLSLLQAGLFAYAIEVPAYIGLKKHIKRERPFVRLNSWHYIVPSDDKSAGLPICAAKLVKLLYRDVQDEFSFPSGHTAAAMVWAVLIATFYPAFLALVLVWALMVGASRVLLGVHYPGDILAGLVLGISSAYLGLNLASWFWG